MPRREYLTPVQKLAWRLHHENGCPSAGRDEPCWGPTVEELAEAKRRMADPQHLDGGQADA